MRFGRLQQQATATADKLLALLVSASKEGADPSRLSHFVRPHFFKFRKQIFTAYREPLLNAFVGSHGAQKHFNTAWLDATRRLADLQSRVIDAMHNRKVIQIQTRVLSSDGRIRYYDLDYYVSMVSETAYQRSESAFVLEMAASMGYDLVKVVGNGQVTGCYCEAFTDKIFSIQGHDRRFSLLRAVGAPPFHPFCTHRLQVMTPEQIPANWEAMVYRA